jgi:hypothetical protein
MCTTIVPSDDSVPCWSSGATSGLLPGRSCHSGVCGFESRGLFGLSARIGMRLGSFIEFEVVVLENVKGYRLAAY